LLKRDAVIGIDVEQVRRDGDKAQALFHDIDADKKNAAAIASSVMPFSRMA
jgi:hypothetical protein